MKRILVCDRGDLKEWYGQAAADGGPLRLRRLEQAGRLELKVREKSDMRICVTYCASRPRCDPNQNIV
jgi:hypothetical protein